MSAHKPLGPRQRKFVDEYLVDSNGKQAAIRCGYKEKTAASQASRLLTKANVAAAIAEGQKQIKERLDLSAERVLLELARIGYSDPRRLLDENGNLKPIRDLDDDTAASLSSFEVEFEKGRDGTAQTTGVVKLRRFDKVAALNTMARWHGKLSDRVEHTGANGGPIEIVDPIKFGRWVAKKLAEADAALNAGEATQDANRPDSPSTGAEPQSKED